MFIVIVTIIIKINLLIRRVGVFYVPWVGGSSSLCQHISPLSSRVERDTSNI